MDIITDLRQCFIVMDNEKQLINKIIIIIIIILNFI